MSREKGKNYSRLIIVILSVTLAFSQLAVTELITTRDVLASDSIAKPAECKITSLKTSVVDGINAVSLSWNKAKNTTTYKIYYKQSGEKWKRIKTLSSSKTKVTLKSTVKHPFDSGATYMFTVRSYNNVTKKWGKWNRTGTKVTFPANTQNEYVEVETIEFTNTGNTSGGGRGIAEGPFKLEIKIIPSNATDKSVYWTSSNPSVATVSSDGVVTPLKAGRTDIRVHPNGGDYPGSVYELLVVDEELMSQQIFELTNQERIKAGLLPVRNSEFIHKFAMVRAKEISTYFTHRRPNGEFVGYRENIAAYSGDGNASTIITAWMNSPGHRSTILGNYKTLGVGVYYKDNQEYCVQDFCDMDADQTFTITLDCNGGTGPSSIEVSQKQKIHQSDLPIPQRPGYVFKGWSLHGTIFNSMVVDDEGYVLVAVWEPAN